MNSKAWSQGSFCFCLWGASLLLRVPIWLLSSFRLHLENVSSLRNVDYLGKWGSFLLLKIDFCILNVLWNASVICRSQASPRRLYIWSMKHWRQLGTTRNSLGNCTNVCTLKHTYRALGKLLFPPVLKNVADLSLPMIPAWKRGPHCSSSTESRV